MPQRGRGAGHEITRAMIAALEAPPSKLAEMGREGRRRVMEAHDINRNAPALRELLVREAVRN